MSLKPVEIYVEATDQFSTQKIFECKMVKNVTFAAVDVAETLGILTPIAYNESTGYWVKWAKPTQDVDTISVTTDYTGGTWTITVDGNTTGNLSNAASAAQVLAAIVALPNVAVGDFTVVELAAGGMDVDLGGFTVTASDQGNFRGIPVALSITVSSLTGGTGAALDSTVAGIASNGTDVPRALTNGNSIGLYVTYQTTGEVMWEGKANINDIVVDSSDLSDFEYIAKKTFRGLGINIEGLTGVH